MSCCPTCGRPASRRGTQAPKTLRRVITCWACHQAFTQLGPGRRRIVCDRPECELKRQAYRRRGEADLDRAHGDDETPLPVPHRVFLHALGASATRTGRTP